MVDTNGFSANALVRHTCNRYTKLNSSPSVAIPFMYIDWYAIIHYFARKMCHSLLHSTVYKHKCIHCLSQKFICLTCGPYSLYAGYVYKCQQCGTCYCLYHYHSHKHLPIYYCYEDAVIEYNPFTQVKLTIAMRDSINHASETISYQNRLFTMGGHHTFNPSGGVFELDIQNKRCITKASMKCDKYFHTLFSYKGFICTVGGYNNRISVADCEKYDVAANQWTKLPDLQTPRRACAAFERYSFIYAFCGYSYDRINSMERRSLLGNDKWEYFCVRNPPTPRMYSHGVAANNMAVIVGG